MRGFFSRRSVSFSVSAWRRISAESVTAMAKIKLIYQVSKGPFVGGLQVCTRETPTETEAYIDTMTCRNPDQIIEESKFYGEFRCDDPVYELDRHARMLFPTASFAYKPEDLRVVEYEYDGIPPVYRDQQELL